MRTVICSVLVLQALGSPAAAEDALEDGRPAVFVGGGLGLVGVDPLFEGHVGGGWRASRWTAAGLVAHTYVDAKGVFGPWSIARHEVELVALLTFQPMVSRSAFHLHGQLGIGAAFDRLSGVDPETSTRSLSGSIGAGAGWGPAALTVRYVIPESWVCVMPSGSAPRGCYQSPAGVQGLLSLTFELYSMFSGS